MKFLGLSLRKRGKSPPPHHSHPDGAIFHEIKEKSIWSLPRTKQDIALLSSQAKKYSGSVYHDFKMNHWKMQSLLSLHTLKTFLKVAVVLHLCYNGPGVLTRSILNLIPPRIKKDIGTVASDMWKGAEKYGLYEKLPKTFNLQDYYLQHYPGLQLLDDHWETIRDETVQLLQNHNKEDLGTLGQLSRDAYFQNNQEKEWRQFFLKMGVMIDENRQFMPKTFDLVQQTPEILNLYISILDPHFDVPAHWKYYKGMVKYHLGLIVPNNNADKKVFIRADDKIEPTQENLDKNHLHAIAPALDAPRYYWREGEGVLWDDMLYHEVKNDADSLRVIVLADVYRHMPWYLSIINKIMVTFAYMDPDIKKMQKNCVFKGGHLEDHSDIALSSAF